MQYELKNVVCSECDERHDKVTVQHGFVFDFFFCTNCAQNSRV